MYSKEKISSIRALCPDVTFLENEPLCEHTSFRVGGPAAWMAFPNSVLQLQQLLAAADAQGIHPRILGAGTNVLAPDAGLQELVICTKGALLGLRRLDENRMEAMAGETLAHAAVFARDNAWTGLEFAHGIPGTVGGGVYMNAGAYGGEIAQVAEETTILSMDGTMHVLSGSEQAFGYRESAFAHMDCIVVKTVFRLRAGVREEIQEKMQELMAKRRASQPLELPSAGSTFKRPAGAYAGALIEASGLKGKGVGGAQVSSKHAGFVVNFDHASAADILKTIEMVQEKVRQNSGFWLEPEVRIW